MPRWPERTVDERFLLKVDKNGPVPAHRPELGPCWIWLAAVSKTTGYGQFQLKINGRNGMRYAHRVAFFLVHGRWPEPDGCHHCDNRACVKSLADEMGPAHIFEGTDEDNRMDAVQKGRFQHGPAHWKAKLTEEDVRAIRVADGTQREIADRYGVDPERISRIRSGHAWRHVQ